MYKRNCPTCGEKIEYKYLGDFNKANKVNRSCSISCSKKKIKKENSIYKKVCPICKKEKIYYHKGEYEKAIKYDMACSRSCAAKKGYLKRVSKKESIFYKRHCPICKKELTYDSINMFNQANKKNVTCSEKCSVEKIKMSKFAKRLYLKYNCPVCKKEIIYHGEKPYENAVTNNITCSRTCGAIKRYGIKQEIDYKRNCPQCNKEIQYKGKLSFNKAEMLNSKCKSCTAKINNSLKYSIEYKRKCPICDLELIYNTKNQFDIANKNNKCCSISCGSKLSQNKKEVKEKKRKSMLGKNNPMHGKPSPQGSGNGWSGKYKGIHFRSLNELFYLKYLLDNNIRFDNAEKKNYRVEYEFNNGKHSYGMDFYLIDFDKYIEIKPKRLISTPKNKAKFKAARKIYGDKFKIITEDDIDKIDLEDMYNLHCDRELVFDKKYEEKFIEYYQNNSRRDVEIEN